MAETPNQITKLPKWAQEYIRDIKRERETAVRALNQWTDDQTVAPFRVDELECLGEQRGPSSKTRYIQATRMKVEHAGVELEIVLREGLIDISWGAPNHKTADTCFQPRSYQSAYLFAKENMRG